MNIPAAALNDLICNKCYTLLSGITYTFPEKDVSLCEKCARDTQEDKFREIAYEATVANFLFPCENTIHGCWKKLKSTELQKHETSCPFTIHRCILECGWSGFESRFIEHFTDAHPSKILKHNENTMLKIGDYILRYLLVTEAQIFQVDVKVKNQFIKITVIFPYKIPKHTTYRASITFNDTKKAFIIKNNSEGKYSTFKFEDEVFNFKICILDTKTLILTPSPENNHLLNSLICNKCKSLMSSKIYCCINSHNCCEECKKEPCTCFESFLTRNHTLESLAEECLYPCKYSNCVQILAAGKRAAHEKSCEFAVRKCPICEHHVDNATFHGHLTRKHRLYVKRDDTVEYYFTEAAVIDCFYLHRMNGYFRLAHKVSRKMFCFSVQYWGNPALAGNYAFCVKMKSEKSGEEFVGEQKCVPFTSWEKTFDDHEGFMAVPFSVLKSFINDKMLKYRVYIYGVCDC